MKLFNLPTIIGLVFLLAVSHTVSASVVENASIISLVAVNGNYVSADNDGNELIANRPTAGNFEKFEVIDAGSGEVGLKCLGNGKYVCAEDAGSKSLMANRDRIGSWEKFTLQVSGDQIGFIASINGKYVCAENKGVDALIANRDRLGSWETFNFNTDDSTPIIKIVQPSSSDVSSNIGVVVEPTDQNVTITKIELYIDDAFVRRENFPPYEWGTANTNSDDPLLLNLAKGSHRLRAEAYDNDGEKSTVEMNVSVSDSEPDTGNIKHIGTTEVWDKNGKAMTISRPSGSRAGDLLILILHRTDDYLPLYLDGWERVAECYKGGNGSECAVENDCTDWYNSKYCFKFDNTTHGWDLAQSVFFREVDNNEPSAYTFSMITRDSSKNHPSWAILTALRGADTLRPVRDWNNKGCDHNADSVFPSVYGQKDDMLLLSQSFDDRVAKSKFGAPTGTSTFGYVSNSDEAGFLFGGILNSTGETGTMKTHGDGAATCKDALVSLTIKPQ